MSLVLVIFSMSHQNLRQMAFLNTVLLCFQYYLNLLLSVKWLIGESVYIQTRFYMYKNTYTIYNIKAQTMCMCMNAFHNAHIYLLISQDLNVLKEKFTWHYIPECTWAICKVCGLTLLL